MDTKDKGEIKKMYADLEGNKFETLEEIMEDAETNMGVEDYGEFGNFTVTELLTIIFKNGLYEEIEDKTHDALMNYIDWYYSKIEEEEDEN